MALHRYFRRVSTGEWYAGAHSTDGEFTSDGQRDADEIAKVCGLPAGTVVPVTQEATMPDPRSGVLFSEPATLEPLAPHRTRCRDYVVSTAPGDTADRLDAYLANASPTAAETVATVKETVRTLRALIRVVRGMS